MTGRDIESSVEMEIFSQTDRFETIFIQFIWKILTIAYSGTCLRWRNNATNNPCKVLAVNFISGY